MASDAEVKTCVAALCDWFTDTMEYDTDVEDIACSIWTAEPLPFICHCNSKDDQISSYRTMVDYHSIKPGGEHWCFETVDVVNQSSVFYDKDWTHLNPILGKESPATVQDVIERAVFRFYINVIKAKEFVKEIITKKELPSASEFLANGGWTLLIVGIVLYIMASVLVTQFARFHIRYIHLF